MEATKLVGDREVVVSFRTNQLLRHEELDQNEVRIMAMATTEPFQHVWWQC